MTANHRQSQVPLVPFLYAPWNASVNTIRAWYRILQQSKHLWKHLSGYSSSSNSGNNMNTISTAIAMIAKMMCLLSRVGTRRSNEMLNILPRDKRRKLAKASVIDDLTFHCLLIPQWVKQVSTPRQETRSFEHVVESWEREGRVQLGIPRLGQLIVLLTFPGKLLQVKSRFERNRDSKHHKWCEGYVLVLIPT